MRVFALKNSINPEKPCCAILRYDEETDEYFVTIAEWATSHDLPTILALYLETRGSRKLTKEWSRKFVEERVIPPDRQNIGSIMRVVGMTHYSEFPLLEYTNGRTSRDDFYLEEMKD